MRNTLNDLYKEYEVRHGGNPKHDFTHFIVVMVKLEHHRELIRPKIQWWEEARRWRH